ncbi:MAG: carboxypeptidase regulatory-like domain-containing protein [Saprospiraceae bacterium]|nr:carboxypeptidase regulatory-like domain-containing protein [Saprospiraceae bacterium]
MKNLKVTLGALLLLLSMVSWWACNQDPIDMEGRLVDVTFAGRIIDESGVPIAGVQVQAGTQTATTDDNGVFRTQKVQLPDRDAILTVSKDGYFEFSRAYIVEDEALQTVTIQLIKKVQVGSFDNASGGTINVPGGPTLKFPANSVNTSGNIRVFARYLNPSDNALSLFMPGDLRAINAGGNEQALATYGMVAVELEGAGGKAQIAEGKEVELTMPIVASQASQAPAEIALWYFDTAKARWIEEGSAQKNGNQYVGKVKHFSFWNCDIGLPLVYLSGYVYLNDLEHPFSNTLVTLTTTSTEWPGYAYTDGAGHFGGAVMVGEEFVLTITAYDQCNGTVLYTQTVGPFNSNTELPPIIVTNSNAGIHTVTGTIVDCNNNPVTNGYAIVNFGAAFADENGQFSYNFSSCASSITVSVQAFDLDNLKESPVQTVTVPVGISTVDAGILTACTGLDEYVQYTIDGQTTTIPQPSAWLMDSTNTNNTVYLYAGAGTTNYIAIQFQADQPGTYPLASFSTATVNLSGTAAAGITTNLTNYAAIPDEYFIGSLSGTYQDQQGGSHTVSGLYRVRRD